MYNSTAGLITQTQSYVYNQLWINNYQKYRWTAR